MTEKDMGSLFKPVFETFYTLKIQDSITSAVSANKAKQRQASTKTKIKIMHVNLKNYLTQI